jgi:hypothetical protein
MSKVAVAENISERTPPLSEGMCKEKGDQGGCRRRTELTNYSAAADWHKLFENDMANSSYRKYAPIGATTHVVRSLQKIKKRRCWA